MALPSRPGEVVIDAIEGDGGRLPLEAARNCAGIAAQQVLHLMGPQPCGVALTIHKVLTLNPVSSAATSEPGPPVGFFSLSHCAGSRLQPVIQRWSMKAGRAPILDPCTQPVSCRTASSGFGKSQGQHMMRSTVQTVNCRGWDAAPAMHCDLPLPQDTCCLPPPSGQNLD